MKHKITWEEIKEGLSPFAWIVVLITLALPPIGGILFLIFSLLGIIKPEF